MQKLKDTALYLDNEGKIMRQKHQDFSLVTNIAGCKSQQFDGIRKDEDFLMAIC